jgi:TorA maturation chaperone TorD
MLLYFAGSMIMYEPTEECMIDFLENEILKNLPVSSSNPNFVKAASQLRNSYAERAIYIKILREDFNKLFAEKNMALAPAYESLYKSKRILNPGQKYSSVTEFYNSYGWVSKFKGKIDDDNLGIELLFLTRLTDKYLDLDDAACQNEMRKEIRRFIEYHLLSWITEWNNKIQASANTLYFKGIGTLILACSEDLFSLLAQNPFLDSPDGNLRN